MAAWSHCFGACFTSNPAVQDAGAAVPTLKPSASKVLQRAGITNEAAHAVDVAVELKHIWLHKAPAVPQPHLDTHMSTASLSTMMCNASEMLDVQDLRWLGQGSQGVVYEAVWQGATVAVKWSIADHLDAGACELLFSKVLSHPNVVQTFDARVAVLDEKFCLGQLSVGVPVDSTAASTAGVHPGATNGGTAWSHTVPHGSCTGPQSMAGSNGPNSLVAVDLLKALPAGHPLRSSRTTTGTPSAVPCSPEAAVDIARRSQKEPLHSSSSPIAAELKPGQAGSEASAVQRPPNSTATRIAAGTAGQAVAGEANALQAAAAAGGISANGSPGPGMSIAQQHGKAAQMDGPRPARSQRVRSTATQQELDGHAELHTSAISCAATTGTGLVQREPPVTDDRGRMLAASVSHHVAQSTALDAVAARRSASIARQASFESDEGFGDPLPRVPELTDLRDIVALVKAKPGQHIFRLVMEYCDQGSLLQAISTGIFSPHGAFGGKVALRALYRTAREVAQGMLHLHCNHVIHGDLKPGNVLLMNSRRDRRGFVARVSDFGLAQFCPSAGRVHGAAWGTLVFMAPERFLHNDLLPASDVWSFGVMLWQMYTADLPYQGAKEAQLIHGIASRTLHLKWPTDSPAPLVSLVTRCMSFNPEERPTFEALMHGLTLLEVEVRLEGVRLSFSMDLTSPRISLDTPAQPLRHTAVGTPSVHRSLHGAAKQKGATPSGMSPHEVAAAADARRGNNPEGSSRKPAAAHAAARPTQQARVPAPPLSRQPPPQHPLPLAPCASPDHPGPLAQVSPADHPSKRHVRATAPAQSGRDARATGTWCTNPSPSVARTVTGPSRAAAAAAEALGVAIPLSSAQQPRCGNNLTSPRPTSPLWLVSGGSQREFQVDAGPAVQAGDNEDPEDAHPLICVQQLGRLYQPSQPAVPASQSAAPDTVKRDDLEVAHALAAKQSAPAGLSAQAAPSEPPAISTLGMGLLQRAPDADKPRTRLDEPSLDAGVRHALRAALQDGRGSWACPATASDLLPTVGPHNVQRSGPLSSLPSTVAGDSGMLDTLYHTLGTDELTLSLASLRRSTPGRSSRDPSPTLAPQSQPPLAALRAADPGTAVASDAVVNPEQVAVSQLGQLMLGCAAVPVGLGGQSGQGASTGARGELHALPQVVERLLPFLETACAPVVLLNRPAQPGVQPVLGHTHLRLRDAQEQQAVPTAQAPSAVALAAGALPLQVQAALQARQVRAQRHPAGAGSCHSGDVHGVATVQPAHSLANAMQVATAARALLTSAHVRPGSRSPRVAGRAVMPVTPEAPLA